jgi:Na+-transporting methylmalonyl-CoA/oxaloacetate decarboxylase beta subunit
MSQKIRGLNPESLKIPQAASLHGFLILGNLLRGLK